MTSTVYIAKTVYGGDGLGRLGDGRVVFVAGAWAGEQVKAEIVEEHRHFVRARLVEVVEPSPERLDPPDEAVPGMVYAALSDAGECAAKESQLREALARARLSVGAFHPFDHAAFPTRNYRNKVTYRFALERGAFRMGYRREESHEIVEVTRDPLACEAINRELPLIRRSVQQLLTAGPKSLRRDFERQESVTIRWTQKSGVKWWIGDAPKDLALKETTLGLDFEVPADGFYQVNPTMSDALARAVVDDYARTASEIPDLVDLYCGVGVFGLCARAKSPQGASLTGVELNARAIQAAKRNAERQGASRARFIAAPVSKRTREIALSPRACVILDPPRGGLEKGVAAWLGQGAAGKILYVSCDLATLVRDLRELSKAYEIESVRWFNLFPRTARFESLVTLRKRIS